MPRRARSLVPGFPNQVLNRANHRSRLFKEDADFAVLEPLRHAALGTAGVYQGRFKSFPIAADDFFPRGRPPKNRPPQKPPANTAETCWK